MHALRNIIFFLFIVVTNAAIAAEPSLEERCSVIANKHIAEMEKLFDKDYTLIDTESFYSNKVESCIFIENTLVGVEIIIRDLSKSIILDGGNKFNVLLHCDINGADSVVLDKVRKLKGRVFRVSYEEWLDDGFGGLPRTLKTPDKPYTKKDCDLVLQKWLSIIK